MLTADKQRVDLVFRLQHGHNIDARMYYLVVYQTFLSKEFRMLIYMSIGCR